jgi:hypothetical protein
VVVVGHGTADPVGAEETRQIAALVAGMLPDVAVELGFLEVIGPSIGEALDLLFRWRQFPRDLHDADITRVPSEPALGDRRGAKDGHELVK